MPDIFVSYAHIDNKPLQENKKGWISYFTKHLLYETSRRLGLEEDSSLWMDFKLKSNDSVTPEIRKQLEESKVLIVMMSKGWLKSKWCTWELNYFCETHDEIDGLIFIIDIDGLPRETKPAITHDLTTCHLYEKRSHGKIRQLGYPIPQADNPDHAKYFEKILDLSDDLSIALEKVQKSQGNGHSTTGVYLAEANDELVELRNFLVSELKQFGIEVHTSDTQYGADDIDRSLAQCDFFVQLLNSSSFNGIPAYQHALAQTKKMNVLQWREPSSDIDTSLVQHQKLLTNEQLGSFNFEEFTQLVIRTITANKKALEAPEDDQELKTFEVPEEIKKFRHLNEGRGVRETRNGNDKKERSVYLAPVSNELTGLRSTLSKALSRAGIQLVGDLWECEYFIQLLDENASQGRPINQLLKANDAGKVIFQWRNPELNIHHYLTHQALLTGETVIACQFNDFSQKVRKTVQDHIQRKKLPVTDNSFVFIQSNPNDFDTAKQLSELLSDNGHGFALGNYDGEPKLIQKRMERGYKFCDILVVLQKTAPAHVVEDYLAEAKAYAKKSTKILLCHWVDAECLHFLPPDVIKMSYDGDFDQAFLHEILQNGNLK